MRNIWRQSQTVRRLTLAITGTATFRSVAQFSGATEDRMTSTAFVNAKIRQSRGAARDANHSAFLLDVRRRAEIWMLNRPSIKNAGDNTAATGRCIVSDLRVGETQYRPSSTVVSSEDTKT